MSFAVTGKMVMDAFEKNGFDVLLLADPIEARNFVRYTGTIFNCTKTFGKRLEYVGIRLMAETEQSVCLNVKKPIFTLDISNAAPSVLTLDDAMSRSEENGAILPVVFGERPDGTILSFDLAQVPHILVAGMDGFGKTNFLRCVTHMLNRKGVCLCNVGLREGFFHCNNDEFMRRTSEEGFTNGVDGFLAMMDWLTDELLRRYLVLAEQGVVNIDELADYELMPHLVLVVDGLEQIAMSGKSNEFDAYVRRIYAKAKAAGIHLIVSQSTSPECEVALPSKMVMNSFPMKVCFKVDGDTQGMYIVGDKEAAYLKYPGEAMVSYGWRGWTERVQTPWLD